MLYKTIDGLRAVDLSNVQKVHKAQVEKENGEVTFYRVDFHTNYDSWYSNYHFSYDTKEERDAEFDAVVMHINSQSGVQSCS